MAQWFRLSLSAAFVFVAWFQPISAIAQTAAHLPPLVPRVLSHDQQEKILAALKAAPPGTLLIPPLNSKEASNYSDQFKVIFQKCGWKVLHILGSNQRPEPSDKIVVGWRYKKTPAYLALVQGLSDAAIPIIESELEMRGNQGIDLIFFDVGVIPMTDAQSALDRLR